MVGLIKKILIFIGALFIACAHQIPPGGGPDDKTPPAISFTVPQRGAVNVSKTAPIVLRFSEWILQLNVDKCITMFPPPPAGIKVSVSGKKLTVTPRKPLADSTTYHLTLTVALQDLHGNSIGTPYDLFFSTGPTIDSGRIFGCVVSQDGKLSQPKVALFPSAKTDSSDTVLFGSPSYLTQTDSFGSFSFDNIHRGVYDCVAFLDDNGNNRIDPGKEQAYAPVRRRLALERTVGPLSLYPVVCDTTTMHIATLKPVSATVVYGEWVGGGLLSPPVRDSTWRIEGFENKRNVPIAEYIPLPNSTRFYLKLGDTLGLAPYRFFTVVKSPLLQRSGLRLGDTIRFNGVSTSDTVSPSVKATEPQGAAELKPRIRIQWSKPVAPRFTRWFCVDSLGDSVPIVAAAGYTDTTIFSIRRSLAPDTRYRIFFPDSAFGDICGNIPKDTAGIKIGFKTISDQELCFSLSGGMSCLTKDSLRKWVFMPTGSSKRFLAPDSAGHFRYDSIPSCKGTFELFTDINHDDRLTKGSLVPWVPPEPFRVFPDTVEARKSWDIEGVTLTGACEECAKKAVSRPQVEAGKTK